GRRVAERRDVERGAAQQAAQARLALRCDFLGYALEESLVLVRARRRLEEAAGAAVQVAEVEAALLGALDDPARQRDGVLDHGHVRGRGLAHVAKDRPLGAGGDDRVGDALDPDARPAAAAAVRAADRLERIDAVGARVLAEAEEDHARTVRHAEIIAYGRRIPRPG